jgi:hypothetical protein
VYRHPNQQQPKEPQPFVTVDKEEGREFYSLFASEDKLPDAEHLARAGEDALGVGARVVHRFLRWSPDMQKVVETIAPARVVKHSLTIETH